MHTLTDLANKFASDKGTTGPSVNWNVNNYTDVYQAYMEPYREQNIKLLEVGIGIMGSKNMVEIQHGKNTTGGASLQMWSQYFSNGSIYGADINDAKHIETDKIKTFQVDQGNAEQLQELVSKFGDGFKFDFIIDDGSHHPAHQQLTMSFLFPLLKSGGIYFIEDLAANGIESPGRNKFRFFSDDVYSTRKLFQELQSNGKFIKPNSFVDEDAIIKDISFINFHTPPVSRMQFLRHLPGRLFLNKYRRLIHFESGNEKLVAIGKK